MDSTLQEIATKMQALRQDFDRYKSGGPQPNLTDAMMEISSSVYNLARYVDRFKERAIGNRSV